MSNQLTLSAAASVLALAALTLSFAVPAPAGMDSASTEAGTLVPALVR
jgi:hypothetical protein